MRLQQFFKIGYRKALRHPPYVIAEAGVNHEGCMETARRLIDEACEAGADGIKFQTYRAATIASRHSPAYWDLTMEPTTSQFELFSKYDRFWKLEFEELKLHCDAAGIEFLSTPFDMESACFLNDLMDAFKISSSDITNKPFIEYLCGFGKPVILSTGASNLDEISEAVGWIDACGNPLALLHCILNYPTSEENANLGMIPSLRDAFPGRLIGYSDHTQPGDMRVLETAMLLGAVILEKHFTHDKFLPGNDHYHAMDRHDLMAFRQHTARISRMLGSFEKRALACEQPARANARRSLVAGVDIPAGKVLERSDLTWKRPASGISPRYLDNVVGKTAVRAIGEDELLSWELLR